MKDGDQRTPMMDRKYRDRMVRRIATNSPRAGEGRAECCGCVGGFDSKALDDALQRVMRQSCMAVVALAWGGHGEAIPTDPTAFNETTLIILSDRRE